MIDYSHEPFIYTGPFDRARTYFYDRWVLYFGDESGFSEWWSRLERVELGDREHQLRLAV